MRLTELSLEKYGCYIDRKIEIPNDAGLVVIYGPNEAGKSTCLDAISDFLFGIPHSTLRGETYGYPNMRIGASMRLANGEVLMFRRRKGNARTLIDGNGTGHDDAVLTSTVLDAITRNRFENLFGLNHEKLRSGGEDLLKANGAIGQLIVEAGGGLREMVRRLEAIDQEADTLFSTKSRSTSRKFYQSLSDFQTAVDAARSHVLSRETYEEARRKAELAKEAAEGLRAERKTLSASISVLERVLRVGPVLRKRDQHLLELEAFADTTSYPEDFSTKVNNALRSRGDAEKNHAEAVEKRERVKGKMDGISVSAKLLAAEKVIVSLSERAIEVSGARNSRPNRHRDIDLQDAKLHPLREMLRLPPTASVAEMLPERAAIDRAQLLAAEALERKPALETAEERVSELAAGLRQIEESIEEDKLLGHDQPVGVSAARFGSLVVQKANLDARRRNVEEEKGKIGEDVVGLGIADIGLLSRLSCPNADEVRAEQTARDAIRTSRLEQERIKRKADQEARRGLEDIKSLEAGGPIATVEVIDGARETRDAHWQPIRIAFVEGRGEGSLEGRRNVADAFEGQTKKADDLSDRRANEANRVASLVELERGVAGARAESSEAEREIVEFAKQMGGREEAFAFAYPDVSKRFPALPALLDFSTRRKDLLDRAVKARGEAADIAVKTAELGPVLEVMERAESKLGLDATVGFAARVEALQAAITQHDQRRADHARDLGTREETAAKLRTATTKRDGLRAEQEDWRRRWPDAIRVLGSSATTSLTEGSTLAMEWIAARGILTTIAEIKNRLTRMDDDEAALRKDVSETARDLEIDVAEDGVAGAKMLKTRWEENRDERIKLDGLKEEYGEAKVDAQNAEDSLRGAEQALVTLASAIGMEVTGLSASAARFDARRAIEGQIAEAERTATEAGDRLPIATLEKEWAKQDLDAAKANLEDARARAAQIEKEVEEAILREKEGRDALAAFAGESEVNRAIVQREGATAQMHMALERYLELALASDLLNEAMAQVRAEQQDPLVAHAGVLFSAMTKGEFVKIETDIDENGLPVVKGKRANGGTEKVATMSDGTRDQLFLAFRLASLERYGEAAEPLPFVADDILIHFDGERSKATLDLLATLGEKNQVLLFTHDAGLRDAAAELAKEGRANIVDLEKVT